MIRPARLADVPAMARVASDSYRDGFAAILPPGVLAERDPAHFEARFAKDWPRMAVAEVDGAVAGFSLVSDGHIDMLFVSPRRQGGGVGADLLRAARAAGAVSLECFRDNTRARAFYEREGWRQTRAYARDFAGARRHFVFFESAAGSGIKPSMATEDFSPRYADLDAWPTAAIMAAMLEGQFAAVAAVQAALPAIAAAVDGAAQMLAAGGKLVYVGAGTSGRIGVQDGAELPPTFDWPRERIAFLMAGGEAAFTRSIEGAEDDADGARAQARALVKAGDVVIGLAASGTTPFTIAAVEAARDLGALTIAVANNPDAPLLAAARHPILVATGGEVLAGSTRMKAGTAQKIVLNLISTGVMIRLGRVYRGLMVDMRASNAKLIRRAARMVQQLTGCDAALAEAAVAAAKGEVKTAVLIARGLAPDAARAALARAGGNLRAALAGVS